LNPQAISNPWTAEDDFLAIFARILQEFCVTKEKTDTFSSKDKAILTA
jgi:hypothetical protein